MKNVSVCVCVLMCIMCREDTKEFNKIIFSSLWGSFGSYGWHLINCFKGNPFWR